MLKNICLVLLALAMFVGLSYAANGLFVLMKGTFAPINRAIDNKVFKESEQYNDSMIRGLDDFMVDYSKATEEQKSVICGVVNHRYSVFNKNKLSYEHISFIQKCKGATL